ncbi:ArsR/SmtB family transcription factor [Phenylobacterium aquaticum]|uniref:ArsR/SmtB family transcription factor n=1 Tax=Phenylobacterium aquaticum TaxID=1763816 RepID=UPI001F5D91C4|nr:metalloregulator ArsR/SmtB family transcription factor [Phenylobacterium aquaticum]MCI3131151.1 metalloregulator ArsR/SmtB family transcription factor [Phenylobacterium aquaticum]
MHEFAVTQLMRTLSDPTRRAVFERLSREGELTVGALTEGAGVSQPAVSQHLAALKIAGLVRERREGRRTHYRVEPAGLAPLIDWFAHYSTFWPERFDQLEAVLKDMD